MKCETMDFLKMIGRMINATSKRVGLADEHELTAMYGLKLQMDQALQDAIQRQIAEGKSWSQIGAALGMTKQGAFRRFSIVSRETSEV